ncbi:histidine kinase [Achromobacter sp. GG226]|uniref:ATP-binding protein n=1 Tax=Verticiella alkaliphila TaxID=2779529 RepID=UPI001C0D2184|nr:ATP-binding protein [Verticiella sp. GG226]MBU4610874.1 histidine kinase [Verticiella sp. GG226]
MEPVLLLHLPLVDDHAVVSARRAAREVAQWLGASSQDQIRVATLASEAARHARRLGDGGHLGFWVGASRTSERALILDVGCPASGGADDPAAAVLRDLDGAARLMDHYETTVDATGAALLRLYKDLPAGEPPSSEHLQALAERLGVQGETSSLQELQRQNRELVLTLAALRERQEELARLTSELEDTNRGVVALYAEIDAHARQLKRADEAKSRFLSSMSHELRTPLASIRALSTLLLSKADGDLGEEQTKQVQLIYHATADLIGTVDDLLDLAKIEAGKVVLRVEPFSVAEFFSALRGMLKPLSSDLKVELVFDELPSSLLVTSDEAKVGQIVRNFISNALKFTPQGRVSVGCEALPDGAVRLVVADSGIGIPQDQLDIIFEEFTQVENPLQRNVKGTGLGLPLCRRLADLLHARIEVQSEPGRGSIFALWLPGPQAAPSSTSSVTG